LEKTAMVNQLPEIMTIHEVADFLRIPVSSVYKLAQAGKIPAQKVGRHWRFHRQTLVNWIARTSPDEIGSKVVEGFITTSKL
jgi:excisionase family DNA binding protein